MDTRIHCSILACIHSVWPSLGVWIAVDICQSIPNQLHISDQKVAENWGPWSEMIFAGSLRRRTVSLSNNLLITGASIEVWQGIKCRIFESLSTTTQIASKSSLCGNPTTRSIEISSPGSTGTCCSGRTPNVKCWAIRERWPQCPYHISWSTCLRMSLQSYRLSTTSNIFVLPGCPASAGLWWSCINCSCNRSSSRM